MPDVSGNYQAGAARSVRGGDHAGLLIAGRYRLLARLGWGAMADVYRAHDETLDRDVAIKLFRAVMDEADTAGQARRELELQALAQLSHPNLITLFDGSVSDSAADGPAFLALELVEGPSLAAVLRNGALPEPQVRRIGAQMADALAYIHERGIVHRDVKPANILLGTDALGDPSAARARLSDFGIVRLVDERAKVTAADLTVGTAYYLAPEQARSAAVGPAADVYALGLVLVEALTGARAFEGPLQEVLVARLTRDPHIPAGLPQPWPALLSAMTASDPAARPTAAQVARTLHSSLESGTMPIAGVAGLAGGFAGETARAGATAAAAARTAALAKAGAPPTSPRTGFPLAGISGPDNRSLRSSSGSGPGPRKLTGLTLAAAVVLAVIAGGGWFLMRPPGHPTPQQRHVGTTAGTSSAEPQSGHRAGSKKRNAAGSQQVNLRHKRHTRPPAHRSPKPGPSTAASTASVAPSTAPPTHTSTSPPSTSIGGTPTTSAGAGTGGGAKGRPGTQSTPASRPTSSAPSQGTVQIAQQQLVSGLG